MAATIAHASATRRGAVSGTLLGPKGGERLEAETDAHSRCPGVREVLSSSLILVVK